MFRGTHYHNMDSKGRLSVPTKFRDELEQLCAGQMVVTIDGDQCLAVYPLPYWEDIERKLADLPSTDPVVKKFQRLFIGYAEELVLDGQGRILISPALRTFARLEKAVAVNGRSRKFEIWDRNIWSQYETEGLKTLPADLAALGGIGL